MRPDKFFFSGSRLATSFAISILCALASSCVIVYPMITRPVTIGPSFGDDFGHEMITSFQAKDSHLGRVSYRYNRPAEMIDFDPRHLVNTEKRFPCTKKILLVGWWDWIVEPLKSFIRALKEVSDCDVETLGTQATKDMKKDDDVDLLLNHLNDSDIVLWWNWGGPLERMEQARRAFPDQTWVLLNWDDPNTIFMAGNMHLRKHMFQIVFSSGTAALPTYLMAGAKEAHAFVPMVDDEHFYDPQLQYETDVAFIGTQLHNYPGTLWNRTAILEALVKDAKKTNMRLSIYGPPQFGAGFPEFYKGHIKNEENRKVWSSAKISMNFHCVGGYGGWYANARNTEILGSRGLLVVDQTVEGPLRDGKECVFWKGNKPEDIVRQVHDILDNYKHYEPIRDRGYRFAQTHFSGRAHAVRVLEAITRLRAID